MSIMWNALCFFIALAAMEGVAWASHKYLMHGPLWTWHASHHRPYSSRFERNDLFGLVFAGLTLVLFWWAARENWPSVWWATLGIAAYGLIYVLFHDGLVHRRFPIPWRPRRGYFHRLIQAHYIHHHTHTRDGAVSFGFLLPPNLKRLRQGVSSQRRAAAEQDP